MNHQVIATLTMRLLATSANPAGIRKCKDQATGKIVYTDHICPKPGEQTRLEIHDNHVGALPQGTVRPFTPHSDGRPRGSSSGKSSSSGSSTSSSSPGIRSGY